MTIPKIADAVLEYHRDEMRDFEIEPSVNHIAPLIKVLADYAEYPNDDTVTRRNRLYASSPCDLATPEDDTWRDAIDHILDNQ